MYVRLCMYARVDSKLFSCMDFARYVGRLGLGENGVEILTLSWQFVIAFVVVIILRCVLSTDNVIW